MSDLSDNEILAYMYSQGGCDYELAKQELQQLDDTMNKLNSGYIYSNIHTGLVTSNE